MDDRRSYDRGQRDGRYNRNRGNDRRNQSQDRGRPSEHQPIDYWENIKNVLDRDRDVGRRHLSFTIDMQRPVFMDGTMGYYRLNTFIRLDGSYMQLPTSALAAMANYFHYNRDRIINAIDEVRNRNAKIDEMIEERNENGNNGHGETDRFKGLSSEQVPDDDQTPDDSSDEDAESNPEDEENDYEEVLIVNEEEPKDESGNVQSSPDTQPRRVRRTRD